MSNNRWKHVQALAALLGILCGAVAWSAPSVAVPPVSIESSVQITDILMLESHRQEMLLDLQLLEWESSTESLWGTVTEYAAYSMERMQSMTAGFDYRVRLSWTVDGERAELYSSGNEPLSIWKGPFAEGWTGRILALIRGDSNGTSAATASDKPPVPIRGDGGLPDSEDADILNRGFVNRVKSLQNALADLRGDTVDVPQCLEIARLWALEAAPLSLRDNRPFMIDCGHAEAWLAVARRAGLADGEGVKRRADEIQSVVDFLVFCREPAEGDLPETRTIRKVFDLALDAEKQYPPIETLYDLVARQRVMGNVRGFLEAKIAFMNEHPDGLGDGASDQFDIGWVAQWPNPRWRWIDFNGCAMLSSYNSRYRRAVMQWAQSFDHELFALFPDARPSGDDLWSVPWEHVETLLQYVAANGAAPTPSGGNAQELLDACGFGLLACWNKRGQTPSMRQGFHLVVDDVQYDFLVQFQDALQSHARYYEYQGWNEQDDYWDRLASFFGKGRWLSNSTLGPDIHQIPQENSRIQDEYDALLSRLRAAVASRDRVRAADAAREIAASGLIPVTSSLLKSDDMDFAYASVPLGAIFYRAGLVDEGLVTVARLADHVLEPSTGPEVLRSDVLALVGDDLSAWASSFRPCTNSAQDRYTRIQYAFQIGDFATASSLVAQNLNHYGGIGVVDLFGISTRMAQSGNERSAIDWQLLDHALLQWDASANRLPRWYRAMNRYMGDDPGWRSFSAAHSLGLLCGLYERMGRFYLGGITDAEAISLGADFKSAIKQMTGTGAWQIDQKWRLAMEWATLLGDRLAGSLRSANRNAGLRAEVVDYVRVSVGMQTEMMAADPNFKTTWRLLPLFVAVRAVRYGAPADTAAEYWLSALNAAAPRWKDSAEARLTAMERALLGSQYALSRHLSRIDEYSNDYCLDAVEDVNVDIGPTFNDLFVNGDDVNALELAMRLLACGDPQYALFYLRGGQVRDWCRENAPNMKSALAWATQYDASRDDIEKLQSRRKKALPSLPDLLSFLQEQSKGN